MKGSELLSQLVLLFVLIGVGFVAGGLVLWVTNITHETGWGSTYALVLHPIHQPIKYESMLMAYLETTHVSETGMPEVPMKEIIIKAIEDDTPEDVTITYESETQEFDLGTISTNVFDSWFEGDPYLFVIEIEGIEHRVAGSSGSFIDIEDKKISVKKLKVPIVTSKNDGAMIMYVQG